MNSSSSAKTYMRFQNHLLNDAEKDNSICALVEVISKRSDNKPWVVTIDGIKQLENENIRRMSIDKFYEIVTGDKLAFKKLCMQLPITIKYLIEQNDFLKIEEDSVIQELKAYDSNTLFAIYKLAFSTYEGFDNLD
ncbi:Eco47II family restriction endonuclease [Psittacicella hinzii]|uniref:Eco47II family restriction endonuclease n=1 Tax=Psittacicella hinzii TaxID=2028575 RepID=UPI0024830E91|nr:Eco47II family restriction endonuclease [Psittacicella hinzii]